MAMKKHNRTIVILCTFLGSFLAIYISSLSIDWLHAEELKYPIVFTDATHLTKLGLALEDYGKNANLVKPFRNRCYYYGDGGYSLSISDQFLETYKARGFSLNSLCMALVSGIRFDPETGAPLPAYIVADLEGLRQSGKYIESGVVSDILPLQVPDCFKRGLPYSDCEMRYDPMSGDQLSEQTSRYLKKVGNHVEEEIENLIKSGKYIKDCSCDEKRLDQKERCRLEKHCGAYTSGRLAREIYHFNHGSIPVSEDYVPYIYIAFVDISTSLPRGFGYALYAEGGAGASASPDSVKLVLEGKHRATEQKIKATVKKLKEK